MAIKKIEAFELPSYVGKTVSVIDSLQATQKNVYLIQTYEDGKHVLGKYNHAGISLPTTAQEGIEYYADVPEPVSEPIPEPEEIKEPEVDEIIKKAIDGES